SPDGHRLASASSDGTVKVWDARPWSAAASVERDALGLLDFLFAKPLRKADVIEHLKNSAAIRPPARQAALDMIERYKEETDPNKYHAAAGKVIRHPYANAFMCRFALAQMKTACARAPDHAQYRLGLGVAHYRLGKFDKEHYQQALATLTMCDRDHPTTLAFLTMTQHQLEEKDTKTTLLRLREAMKQERWTNDRQAQAFLAEAEALVQAKRTAGKK